MSNLYERFSQGADLLSADEKTKLTTVLNKYSVELMAIPYPLAAPTMSGVTICTVLERVFKEILKEVFCIDLCDLACAKKGDVLCAFLLFSFVFESTFVNDWILFHFQKQQAKELKAQYEKLLCCCEEDKCEKSMKLWGSVGGFVLLVILLIVIMVLLWRRK